MNKSASSIAVLMTVSPLAFAEGQLDGLNVALGAGIYNADSAYHNSGAIDISGNQLPAWSKNDSKLFGDVSIGYSHSFENKFNIAGNLFYNFGSTDQSYHNANAVDISGNEIVDSKFKLRDLWGISIEPGYYITDNTLGYLKLGYAFTSVKASTSGYMESVNYNFGNPGGILYGIGMKHSITNNIFVGADLYRINFGTSEISNSPHFSNPEDLRFKLDVNYFGVKIGYTFN